MFIPPPAHPNTPVKSLSVQTVYTGCPITRNDLNICRWWINVGNFCPGSNSNYFNKVFLVFNCFIINQFTNQSVRYFLFMQWNLLAPHLHCTVSFGQTERQRWTCKTISLITVGGIFIEDHIRARKSLLTERQIFHENTSIPHRFYCNTL